MMIFRSLVDRDYMRQDKIDRFRHLVATFQDCLCMSTVGRGSGERGEEGKVGVGGT